MAGILSYEPPFDSKIAENFGYVSSVEEAYKVITESETWSSGFGGCTLGDRAGDGAGGL